MRIRSIKPEFWRSSDISSLAIEDRLLFIGLWSYVDDNGVGVDKLAAITADLFADDLENDAPETFARVSRGLASLSEAGRIVRYTVNNASYLCITNWGKHQRIDKPGKPRYPRPDAEDAEIRESVASLPEKVAPGTEEQRNRGTEEVKTSSSPATPSKDFDSFWAVYPKKVAKQAAIKVWNRITKTVDAEQIIEGAARYAEAMKTKERDFIKSPDGWLNAGRWEDELPTATQSQIPAAYRMFN